VAGRLYRRGGVWYCWGYDTRGERWRESTKQHDRKTAEITAREITRRRAFESTDAAPVRLRDALVKVGEADARAGRSAATRQVLTQKGRQLVAFFKPDFNIARVTKEDLERYTDHRVQSVTRHTIAHELATLRRAMRVCGVPWSSAMMPDLGRYYVPRTRWLPWGEYLKLHGALNGDRGEFLAAYCYAGPRRSELHRLDAKGVDLDRNMVFLPGEKTLSAPRWIPIHPSLRPILERRAKATPAGPLFPDWGNDIRDLSAGAKRAGLVRLTPNDLRRTFCSWLANAGVSTLVAARLMGHTSTRMVEKVYAQLGIEIRQDAIGRLPGVYASEPDAGAAAEEVDTEDDETEENPR